MILRLIPVLISATLLAAHYSRASNDPMVLVALVFPALLFFRKRWVVWAVQLYLVLGGFVWIDTAYSIVKIRQSIGESWFRMALILSAVAVITALSALVFRSQKLKDHFPKDTKRDVPLFSVFCFTAVLLIFIQVKVDSPMLLLERFFPGWGVLEILVLSVYAVFVLGKMIDPAVAPQWRIRIWTFFSVVFFGQLLLGLAGLDKFLMTGKLHVPVPAMIIAGPLFRGGGTFMLKLFLITVLLSGPAWCSHLCYVGAWDGLASKAKKRPGSMPKWRHLARILILVGVVIVADLLRLVGISGSVATILGILFGLVGIGIMVFASRKTGVMAHCITYCPIGLLADWIGRISPFRMRIKQECTECGVCSQVCRYDALSPENIKKRKAGLTCTLCGDCVPTCKEGWIHYGFLKMKPETARVFFLVLVVGLHAIFMGVARL